MNQYNIGSVVRLSVAFTVGTDATDPTTIVFKLEKPDGSIITYTYGTDVQSVRDSKGNYHVDYTLATAGTYTYRFVGTGACAAAAEGMLYVDYSPF